MTVDTDHRSNHRALFHDGIAGFTAAVVPFVEEGLANGDRTVVIAASDRLAELRGAVGGTSDGIELRDSAPLYRPQARSTRAVVEWLGGSAEAGRPARIVLEHAFTGRSAFEVSAYFCLESAASALYRTYPLSMLCAYDTETLAPEVLGECERTHPELVREGTVAASARFIEPATFLTTSSKSLRPPVGAPEFATNDPLDLAAARRFLTTCARGAGLDESSTSDLVLAADEVLANALVHGQPERRVWVYLESDGLVCHVHDAGPGFADPLDAYRAPSPDATHGRGLWMARQLCDAVEISSGASGTHVRLVMLVDRKPGS